MCRCKHGSIIDTLFLQVIRVWSKCRSNCWWGHWRVGGHCDDNILHLEILCQIEETRISTRSLDRGWELYSTRREEGEPSTRTPSLDTHRWFHRLDCSDSCLQCHSNRIYSWRHQQRFCSIYSWPSSTASPTYSDRLIICCKHSELRTRALLHAWRPP